MTWSLAVPAALSSPIKTLSVHAGAVGDLDADSAMSLLSALEQVPDPRRKRGVRHRFSAARGPKTNWTSVSGSLGSSAIR